MKVGFHILFCLLKKAQKGELLSINFIINVWITAQILR